MLELFLLSCVFCIAAGQIFFKLAANKIVDLPSFWHIIFEPYFMIAILIYGLTTFVWVWCLQHVPLSKAYMFMSLAYVFVPFMSIFIFGDSIGYKALSGIVLIITGVMIIGF